MLNTIADLQRMTSQGIDSVTRGVTQTLDSASGSEGVLTWDAAGGVLEPSTALVQQEPQKEKRPMADQDLGGDDLKYVSYSIIFTKRDYEATLKGQTQELVDYPTDGGSYGGLKIANFFTAVSLGQVPPPPEWGNRYPPPSDGTGWKIPTDDQKYIKFIYWVDSRLPRSEADYEKRQAEALEAISRKIAPDT
jgi:hypothetical protein